MRTTLTARTVLAAAAASLALAGAAAAGPINPPAGAIAPTGKTLTQVEPRIPVQSLTAGPYGQFAITQPGSYYLTGDIVGVADKSAIEVRASNVTIDLAGFAIRGGREGIETTAGLSGLTIRNGFIANVAERGIDAINSCSHVTVENVTVTNTGDTGIAVGHGSIVRNCIVSSPGAHGVLAEGGANIESCTVYFAASAGFRIGTGSRVNNSIARSCHHGFLAANSGAANSVLTNCIAEFGSIGFDMGERVALDGCSVSNASTVGIRVGARSEVRNCRATECGHQGIIVANNCVLIRCAAVSNGAGGYAGFWINGSGCRVEENTAISNGYGFYLFSSATDNFIVRNIARNNGENYVISAGNEFAPVVNNPGSNGFSTMTPWSNVSY